MNDNNLHNNLNFDKIVIDTKINLLKVLEDSKLPVSVITMMLHEVTNTFDEVFLNVQRQLKKAENIKKTDTKGENKEDGELTV